MDRLILRVLPAELRERHADELEEMFASTSRPVRDRADVLIVGIGLRLGRGIRPLLAAAVLGAIGFALGLVHAVRNLRDGPVEIPDHWWSMVIAAGFAFSLTAVISLGLAQRRAIVWTRSERRPSS